ncbi:hypothetical protein INT48_001890 [Thamnidium elegans]|uniref:CCHC-type domain-containing protein n=1 Tax=Thamnidium elegans TaxID=101142 RepID=A0A8H7SF56_9FUNG|nr:hypothetical protein INT48_001890 [Thamnidium elegans]
MSGTNKTGPVNMDTGARNNTNDYTDLIKHFSTLLAENRNTSRVKEPSTYDGTRDALLIDGWIRSVERYINFHNWTPERSYLFAATLLRDRADAWFRTIELTDEAPTTWLELKRLITEFFRPDNAARIARDKFAALKQTGDLFIRGLSLKAMRAHIRQYEANNLKEAIHAALSYDSAQKEEDFYARPPPTANRRVIDDPMELDAIDQGRYSNNNNNNRQYNNYSRSNNYNNPPRYNSYRNNNNGGGSYRNNNNSSSFTCHYCQKVGHIKRNCRTRIADIKRLDDQHSKKGFHDNFPDNKDLIDFDPYSKNSPHNLDNLYPILNPLTYNSSSALNITVETIPIIYPKALTEELQYLSELNAISTTLPLYSVSHNGNEIHTLIDSGASENYVSPEIIKALPKDKFTLVQDKQVETAGGNISQIKYKTYKFELLNHT